MRPPTIGPSTELDALVATCGERLLNTGDFVALAEAERLAPLLYYGYLRSGWPDSIPEEDRRALRRAYYRTAGKNVELLSALSDVTEALLDVGIEPVAFKGATLASTVYPNVALRPMGDVDILVRPDQGAAAEATLERAGYRPWAPDMTKGLSRRTRHARLYVGGPNDTVNIDLHWSLVGHSGDERAPHRAWVERSVEDGALSDTAHLLYLAAHMKLQHYDETIPLLWLVDFYRLATIGSIDWDVLRRDAIELGWLDAVAASARDTRERLGVALPAPLDAWADDATPEPTLHEDGARNAPERVLNELSTASWRARMSLARAYVLPSPSYVKFRYRPQPAWLWPLCYPRRWLSIVLRIVQLLRSRESAPRPLLTSHESW